MDRRENRNCYTCGEFEHMAKQYRNRRIGNRIEEGRRLEYGENVNNGQSNLNGKGDLIVFD